MQRNNDKRAAGWRSLARELVGDPELTRIEVAAEAGVDLEQARRLWRALGFAPVEDDERVFTRLDVAMLHGIRSLSEQQGTDPHVLLQLTRVIGQSLARVADAQVSASADQLTTARRAGASGAAEVEAITGAVVSLAPKLEPFLAYVWRRHLLAGLLRFAATEGGQTRGARAAVVGFADLVGFTAISQQLGERDLAAMVDRFEALAYEHVPERGGRVVKMIGDEVMFAVDHPEAAAEIALALVDAYAAEEILPDVRAGLAVGPVLSWEGDLFGPTVNLASRLVNVARPGTVLISDQMGRELETRRSLALIHLRPLTLKGIGRVRVWVLRRGEKESPRTPAPPRPHANRRSGSKRGGRR
jgi:adenylate cyclase